MSDPADTQRLIGDIGRLGTVASVDHATGTCRIRVGEIVTGDLPWLTGRAGATRAWSPPSVGEQCLLICPEGDTAAGIVLPGLYSGAHPAPGNSTREVTQYADGAVIAYDPETHHLEATLPAGGAVSVTADDILFVGNVTIMGALEVSKGIHATDDVVGKGVSLATHRHGGVQAGAAQTGAPA